MKYYIAIIDNDEGIIFCSMEPFTVQKLKERTGWNVQFIVKHASYKIVNVHTPGYSLPGDIPQIFHNDG